MLYPWLTLRARNRRPPPAASAALAPATLLAVAAASLLVASPALASESACCRVCPRQATVLTPPPFRSVTTLAAGLEDFKGSFAQAFLLIFFSEIGDKTFFIAVLLSLQQPRSVVFTGTFGALAVMSVISVALGRLFHVVDEVLPFHSDVPWDDYAAVALLLFFGVRTLQGAAGADARAEEEEEEAKEAVAELSSGLGGAAAVAAVASTFALVFAAEWGDKSFFATIALAAAAEPFGVTAGAVAGHATATAIAVAGGSLLSDYVNERLVAYVGGSLFIAFAVATAAEIVSTHSGVVAR